MNRGLYGLSDVFTVQGNGPPALTIREGTATEGGTIRFDVTLLPASAQAVTLQYATSGGTATQGTDYTAASGTLTFSAGQTSKTIEVSTTEDGSFEGSETLTMTLSSAVGAAFVGARTTLDATGTIIDDDREPPTEILASSSLIPSGLGVGASFRLLFVTSTQFNASDSELTDYDAAIRMHVRPRNQALLPDLSHIKVLGSSRSVHARDHTDTNYTVDDPGTPENEEDLGVPIYWLNGAKVADDYSDFYDGSWDSNRPRGTRGNLIGGTPEVFTGTKANGDKHDECLGAEKARVGKPRTAGDEINAKRRSTTDSKHPLRAFGGVQGGKRASDSRRCGLRGRHGQLHGDARSGKHRASDGGVRDGGRNRYGGDRLHGGNRNADIRSRPKP